MTLYVWVLLFACVGSALTAGVILARDPGSRSNRAAALLSLGNTFWAMCEVAWNTSSDPETVLLLVKLSALGWVWIGPVALNVFLAASDDTSILARRLLRGAYVASALILVLEWTTPWLHPGVVRASWGWAYDFGPLYIPFYLITLSAVGLGLTKWVRYVGKHASPGERAQGRWVFVAVAIPVIIASITDGILPFLGVQVPRFGTVSLMFLSLAIAWSIRRYGYSILAPGRFAPEILGVLSDAVMLLRMNGEVRVANRAMGELVGRSPSELVGARADSFLPFLSPDTLEPAESIEGDLLSISGQRIPVSIAASLLQDRRGSTLGVVIVVRDQREVVALRQRLVISGSLAAVGELAAGIAHEINNPIAYVRSNLGVLGQHWRTLSDRLAKVDPGAGGLVAEVLAEGEELIEESLSGVDRVAGIVRAVKSVAHAGAKEREPADLNAIVERALRVASPQLGELTRVETELGDLPLVECAPRELEQVFLNLILNADQAMQRRGRIRVASRVEGSAVVVCVEDDGHGISPEHLARVFDPFFTTKPQGEGTGLGLSISYQIVRQHGGEITVASDPPHGACFSVRLPLD